jgi:hypothetical protein
MERWDGRENDLEAALETERPAHQAAAREGDHDTAVVWAGEAVDLIKSVEGAAALVARISAETETQLRIGAKQFRRRRHLALHDDETQHAAAGMVRHRTAKPVQPGMVEVESHASACVHRQVEDLPFPFAGQESYVMDVSSLEKSSSRGPGCCGMMIGGTPDVLVLRHRDRIAEIPASDPRAKSRHAGIIGR